MTEEYNLLVEEARELKEKHYKKTCIYELFMWSCLASIYTVVMYGIFYLLNDLVNFESNIFLSIISFSTEIIVLILLGYTCITERNKKCVKILFFIYITLVALRKFYTYDFTSLGDLVIKIVFVFIIHFCIIEIRKHFKDTYIIAIGIFATIAIICCHFIFNNVLLLISLIYCIFMYSLNIYSINSFIYKHDVLKTKSFYYLKYCYLILSHVLFITVVM